MGHRLSKSVSSVANHHHQQQPKSSKNSQKGSNSSLASISSNCPNHHHHHHCQNQNLNHIQSHHCDCCLSSSSNQVQNLEPSLSAAAATVVASAIEIDATATTTTTSTTSLDSSNLTLTVPAQVAATITPRRFIIKIQLTKMEPGSNCDNGDSSSITINNDGRFLNGCDNNMITGTTSTTATLSVENENVCPSKTANATTTIATAVLDNFDNNLNITKPIINLTFTKNITCDESSIDEEQQKQMQLQTQQQRQQEGQHHQIVIESDNETTIHQLNNLNATTIAATINNSNFVNNFTIPSTSTSSLQQLQQRSQLNNEGENNLIEHLSNLNLIPSSANGFILSNNDNNNNNDNNDVSNCNNNFIVTTNLNCLNNNSSNSNNINGISSSGCNQIDTDNSICNNQRILSPSSLTSSNSQQNTFSSTMCAANNAEDDKSHCCRRKKSSAYPAKWRCCKCSCRTNDSSNAAGSSSNCKETPAAAAASNKSSSSFKSSWTSKFNCTKKDTNQSNDEITKQQNVIASSSSVSSSSPLSLVVSNSLGLSSPSISGLSSVAEPSSSSSVTLSSQVWYPQSDILPPQSQPQMMPTLMPTVQSTTSNPMNVSQLSRSCPRSDHLTMWEPIPLPLTPFITDHHHLHHHHHHHHHHIQTTIARCPNGAHHNLFVFSVNRPSLTTPQQQQQPQPQPQLQPSQIVFGQIDDLDLDERARRLRAIEIETGLDPNAIIPTELESALANVLSPQNSSWHHIMCTPSSNFGTVVHSQVDYIHCLVPDLEKITSSSFYWGKMDRYEAERLLEGKPEGTFLLRDSAQEEYLFSVTFRKYGRSLHARIEQFNHKFSFDGHDPGVFTASTVTGLLEHYKDPSCVMFFEPMLTIPLHRNFTFSLQQLCRATIVSHITYDGINELHLPNSLKSYLKEYHYKLRVRVKPFDEPFYTCS